MTLSRVMPAALAALSVFMAAAFTSAEVVRGPAIGNNRYDTTIEPAFEGDVDVDDYSGVLLAGERLDVTVTAARKSTLRPTLDLVTPSGSFADAPVTLKKGGKIARVRRFAVASTGRWTVQVGGAGTTGAYRIQFRVKPPRALRFEGVLTGDGATHAFAGSTGAQADLNLSIRSKQGTATIGALTDPHGNLVPSAAVALDGVIARRRKRARVRALPLADGAGLYQASLVAEDPPDEGIPYTLKVRVRPAERPKARKPVALEPREPRLHPSEPTREGITGTPVSFDGLQLLPSPATRAYIGSAEASVNAMDETSVTLVPPGGAEDVALPVTIVHPDGQFAELPAGFVYAPPLVPLTLTDATGAAIIGGTLGGGHALRIGGSELQRTDSVLFGGRTGLLTATPIAGEVQVLTPSGPSTTIVPIELLDRFGRVVAAPFDYEYKRAPSIALGSPYEVHVNEDLGLSAISVNGTGFEPTDTIVLEGEALSSRLQLATRLVAIGPVLTPGQYSIAVTDRLGLTTTGPLLLVAPPPVPNELFDGQGRRVRQSEVTGGEELFLEGARFAEDTRVRFGEEEAEVVAYEGSTRLRIKVPAADEPGDVELTVTDPQGNASTAAFTFEYYEIPTVPAGTGFTVATAQPDAIGTGAASNAKPMARWDVVPYQTFDRPFEIGVVAFHVNGIDRVEYSAEDGDWTKVDAPRKNPRTGIWEYTARLDPTDFADGPVEVRAIVYPKTGLPRVLAGALSTASVELGEHSLLLNANSGHTLPQPIRWVDSANGSDTTGDGTENKPFATPYKALQDIQADAPASSSATACDGALVYCKAGRYRFGPPAFPYPLTASRWATIRPAPGVAFGDVVFDESSGGGMRTRLVHVKDLAFDPQGAVETTVGDHHLWIDHCTFKGPGRTTSTRPYWASDWTAVYVNDTVIRDFRNGPIGARLVRNVTAYNLGSDAYQNSSMVLDCATYGIDASGTPNHPDVYQFSGTGTRENVIVFGMQAHNADAQGIFVDDLTLVRDIAFVNVLIVRPLGADPRVPVFSQWGIPARHVLLSGIGLPNQSLYWRHHDFEDVVVQGCMFSRMTVTSGSGGPAVVPDSFFSHNHFVDVTSPLSTQRGSDATTGDPGFVGAASGDFRPTAGSVLRNRIQAPYAPIDLVGEPRLVPDVVGPLR